MKKYKYILAFNTRSYEQNIYKTMKTKKNAEDILKKALKNNADVKLIKRKI